jgi:hypothetical protein
MEVLANTNQLLTIVKQEPGGKLELLQQHHKDDLARSQQPFKRDNDTRRMTIHAPDQNSIYHTIRRKRTPSITPSNSIFKFRRYIFSFVLF